MGNDYDGAIAKPDQSRNYKLISDPYLRPGHRVLFRYDGLSCQNRSLIQVCDPRKLKTSGAKSLKVHDLPLPDFAAKNPRLFRHQNCTSNSSPPISFSPRPTLDLSNETVNLDGFNLSREELIKLVQSYQNSKSQTKRPRKKHERKSSRQHSPQWVPPKRPRQGSESSTVSFSTPTTESRGDESSEKSEVVKPEPKESLDSRIAALLGTDQQQQAAPMPVQGLLFPPFFPPYAAAPPPFYDPLRPPPPLPFAGFQPIMPAYSTAVRPTPPPMWIAPDSLQRMPNVAPPVPPPLLPAVVPRPAAPVGPCPEELRQQVICILCGELNTHLRKDLSMKILNGVAFKCIDDWYEANDKRNRILQSGKYLKNSCLPPVIPEESISESLSNGPVKPEPMRPPRIPKSVSFKETEVPKQPEVKYKKEKKPLDVERKDFDRAETKREEKTTKISLDLEDLDDWGEENMEQETEEQEETHVKIVCAILDHPLEPDTVGDSCAQIPLNNGIVDATVPGQYFDTEFERYDEGQPCVTGDTPEVERKGGRFDRVLLPKGNENAFTKSLRKRSVVSKFLPRTAEVESKNTGIFLTEGIDEADIYFVRKSYEEMKSGKVMSALLEHLEWMDHPPTRLKDATLGCARTLGYQKLSPSKKNVQYGPPAAKFSSPIAVRARSRKEGVLRSVGREVRSMQRRLMANIADTDFAEIFRFSQLKLRKKRLQFGRSRIHDWGLFACEHIAAEEMVIEYVGETIRQTVADKREQRLMIQASRAGNPPTSASSYLFRIDADIIIDATNCGNLARFINHSCDPNCYAKIITVDQCKKVVIYSKREIAPGEEITYDYKFPLEDKKIPCNCGAFNCRKTLN